MDASAGWRAGRRRMSGAHLQAVSVIIPALNEERRIADVVRFARGDPATGEVIVVDDCSIDDTASLAREAGARVVRSSMLGKGASMADGVAAAKGEVLVFLDGDLAGLTQGLVGKLAAPVRLGEADFVKARFDRAGGRVTELTAKPMLRVFFPELAHLAQPLGGLVAARRTLLQSLEFENGYGVDVGLLLDAFLAGARLAEVEVGGLEHESQALADLTSMANEVGRVIFERARAAGRMHVEQIAAMYEQQRQAAAGIEAVLARSKRRAGLLLLDMDGTITPSRFVVELARASGRLEALAPLLDSEGGDVATRSERIAALFRFVHRRRFEQVARRLELRPGVIELVQSCKRRGFLTGVVSDSYFIATEIVRRRVFADFSLAHTLDFTRGTCDGTLRINPAFLPAERGAGPPCKSHVLSRFAPLLADVPRENLWVFGDSRNDLQLLERAGRAYLLDSPQRPDVEGTAIAVIKDFSAWLPQPEGAARE
jgi:phosphoserine phosphatase